MAIRVSDTGTGGGSTTDASLLTTGTLDDARLPVAAQGATLSATYVMVVGTEAAPITDVATARPTAVVVYWLCVHGVTPSNAVTGDLIWNAS